MNKAIILCSMYDIDRIEDIIKLAYRCNLPIDLSLGQRHKNNQILNNLLNKHKLIFYKINYHDNYGVDISPFLKQIKDLDCQKFSYFIKIHSKKSNWGRKFHVDWGTVLIDSLIGNAQDLHKNLNLLSREYVGMCCIKFLTLQNNEGYNHNKILNLCKILNINYKTLPIYAFAAGSMFMGKTQVYKNILSEHYNSLDKLLQTETGKVDDRYAEQGTFCHSIERIFGYLVTHQNLKILPTILDSYIIYNKQYKKLHLRITYNNYCYLLEDVNMYGKIMHKNIESIQIQWLHFDNKPIVNYKYLTPSSITIK